MAKDNTFYFSHDYSVRSDIKIKALIRKHKYLGYGLFWAIVEDLYNNDNSIDYDIELLAYDLRVEPEIIKSIICDFDLFVVENDKISNKSVGRRLEQRHSKSNKAKLSAEARWGTDNESRLKAKECLLYLIKIYNKSEEFLKVGITTESVSRRYSGKLNDYNYELIAQCEMSCENAMRQESEITAKCEQYIPLIKFAGYLECISINELPNIKSFAMLDKTFRNAIKESKVNKSKENNIEERKLKFASTLEIYKDKYPRSLLSLFFKYWTEPNKSNTKFKQELEKTWSLERRLETWATNDSNFNKKQDNTPEKKYKEFK
jgi:hypothetical protein